MNRVVDFLEVGMFRRWIFPTVSLLVLAQLALAQDPATPPVTESYETIVVRASRVTVEEVIEAIGHKMEKEISRLENISYTNLVTLILRDDPGLELQNYTIEEHASQFFHDGEDGDQIVDLWSRTRKFENGELVEDEAEDKVEAQWVRAQEQALKGLPFAPEAANRYKYTIMDRRNVGNSLIYKVRFEPKSRFEALPTGVVWVDFSNWAIRKVEAEMVETVPFPLLIKSIPTLRFNRQRVGEYWFTTEVYGLIRLRNVPLLPIPRSAEIRVTLQDIVINGELVSPENAVPDVAFAEPLPTPEESDGFWLSQEASDDSLAAYWSDIDEMWDDTVTPQLEPITLDIAKLDSLIQEGDAELLALQKGGRWKTGLSYVRPQFNRVQGAVVLGGVSATKNGPLPPSVKLAAGYGFSNRRWLGWAKLDLPLVKSRWNLADEPGKGERYRLLTLNLSGMKMGAQFAGDGRLYTRSVSAFFYGSDPNHYFEKRGGGGRLTVNLARRFSLFAEGGYYENRSLEQRTGWNILGRSLRPAGNFQASNLDESRVGTGGIWGAGPLTLSGSVIWHKVRNSEFVNGLPGAPEEADFRELNLQGKIDYLDGAGNRWLLQGNLREFDRQVPVQWKTWLGDFNSLRGYKAGVLTGDAGSWASLDVRLGWDMWRDLKVPFLKNLGLQPIGFVDWGHTWSKSGPYPEGPREGTRDWLADVGFGFGRRFDLPGLGEFNNFRMYAACPVGNGHEETGWRFLVAFEK